MVKMKLIFLPLIGITKFIWFQSVNALQRNDFTYKSQDNPIGLILKTIKQRRFWNNCEALEGKLDVGVRIPYLAPWKIYFSSPFFVFRPFQKTIRAIQQNTSNANRLSIIYKILDFMDGLNRFIMNTYNWSALELRLVIVKILNRFNQILD